MIRRLLEDWRRYRIYWKWAFQSLVRGIDGHWPVFVTLLLFPWISGVLMCLVECHKGGSIRTYWDAVYTTWITMSTVGYGDYVPITRLGQVIACLDALVGLVIVGLIVWLLTRSLGDPPT